MPTTIKGQPIDQRTGFAHLPLPHLDNWQEDDVPRLRAALTTIDETLRNASTAMQERATQAELTAAANALLQAIDGLSSSVNGLQQSKVESVNGKSGTDIALSAADVGALAVGQFGFGATSLPVPAIKDFNAIPAVSQWFMMDLALNAPAGMQDWFLTQQLVHNGDLVCQVAYGMNGAAAGHVFKRQKKLGVWEPYWREISGRRVQRVVNDTTSYMYGPRVLGGNGLDLLNIWSFAGNITKYAPPPTQDGDTFAVLIANGRLDNAIYPEPGVGMTIMGFSTNFILDAPGEYTFRWHAAWNDWRLI